MLSLPSAACYARAGVCSLLIAVAGMAAESPSPPRLTEVRGTERVLLEKLTEAIRQSRPTDAMELIVRLLESNSPGVVAVDENCYIGLPEYCQRMLAKLPAEVLEQYRQHADPLAAQWYREAIANRDSQKLQQLLDQMFCSSWGDDALLALGELALERGDYQSARTAWQRIRLVFPDTDLDLAMVEARLTLLSIREGDFTTAKDQLASLQKYHPKARGRMAGRDVVFAEYLAALLPQNNTRQPSDSVARSYHKLWSRTWNTNTMAVHPTVVGELLIFQDTAGVHALRLATGEPVMVENGMVLPADRLVSGRVWHPLTATNRYVFGAMPNALWGIDLARDGALFFQREAELGEATFAGPPAIANSRVLVPMDSGGRSIGASIACYDLARNQLHWKTSLCQAMVPNSKPTNPWAAQVLTIDSGVVYFSTNLGVVGALRVRDGRVLWLHTYQREPHIASDNSKTCFYYRGVVLIAPPDSSQIFALEAATGKRLWSTKKPHPAASVFAHTNNKILIGNQQLQSLDLQTGKPSAHWTSPKQTGKGQGVLDGKTLLWPTDRQIERFDAQTGQAIAAPIDLPHSGGANLLLAGNYLIAAGPTELTLFFTADTQADSTNSQSQLNYDVP